MCFVKTQGVFFNNRLRVFINCAFRCNDDAKLLHFCYKPTHGIVLMKSLSMDIVCSSPHCWQRSRIHAMSSDSAMNL